MRKTFQTPVGFHVELSAGVFKDYVYCHGCTHGWKVRKDHADRDAARHASSCRRKPNTPQPAPWGGSSTHRRA